MIESIRDDQSGSSSAEKQEVSFPLNSPFQAALPQHPNTIHAKVHILLFKLMTKCQIMETVFFLFYMQCGFQFIILETLNKHTNITPETYCVFQL